jgi:ribonucleoside-diphosphate reductase alpha chain
MILNSKAEIIFKSRYAYNEREEWEGLATRVGRGGASVEPVDRSKWEELFARMINDMLFLPGGRILRNMGRPRGTLFNCYVEPLEDSIEEIGDFQKNCGILWSEGGGVGCNSSFLRPEDAQIVQKGGQSTGPLSFLKWANAGANCIKTGGARRAACLALMLVSHPDIFKFINTKLVEGELNCFNISVGVMEEFLDAVEANDKWNLKWHHKVWKEVQAREIWDLVLTNMVKCAEPGLINWDNLRNNNSYYFDPILSTNPCGEVPLGAHGVCCLGSLVLPKFVGQKNTNWKLMQETVYNAVRFLDNIIQVNRYPITIPEIQRKAFDGRRIGLGFMGLGDYLFAKKVRYGSQEAIDEIEKLVKNIRNYAYEASIKIAEEKGAFPKFDTKMYSKAHFIRSLPASVRMDIKKYGIRNVSLMAVAPTGTISLLPEVTSSAEPLTFKAFMRHDEIGDRAYVHPIYQKIIESGEKTPDWFVDTTDLKPEDHFDTQVIIQKYIDGAISKTINTPSGFKPDQLSHLLLEYIRDLKGVTLYVDGSREEQILVPIKSKKEVKKYIEDGKVHTDAEEMSCGTGSCEI